MTVHPKPRLRRAPVVALTVLALTAVAGCGPSTDKTGAQPQARPLVLQMPTVLGAEEMQPFIDAVHRLSKGTVTIADQPHWHPGQLTNESDLITHVAQGHAPLAAVPARAFTRAGVHSFDALSAPFAVDSVALEQAVLTDAVSKDMLAGVHRLGLTGLGIMPGPVRHPVGVSRQLLRVSDYRTATIGISPSAVADQALTALQATSHGTTYQGSPVDALDGFEAQVASVAGNRYDKDVHGRPRTLTSNVSLWTRPFVLVANSAAFGHLTLKQRDLLQQAAAASVAPSAALTLRAEKDSLDILCRRGNLHFVQATAADLRALHTATTPVRRALRSDPVTAHVLDRTEALRQRAATLIAAEPQPACSGAPAPAQPGSTGALDGTYQFTTTPADLRAIGTPSGDINEANYGINVIIISHGHFAQTQRSGKNCSWVYGQINVRGRQLSLLDTDGYSNGFGAQNQPGESFTYGWSAYRGSLTLTAVDGKISPEPLRAKPWQQLSRKPLLDRFDQECRPPKAAFPS